MYQAGISACDSGFFHFMCRNLSLCKNFLFAYILFRLEMSRFAAAEYRYFNLLLLLLAE